MLRSIIGTALFGANVVASTLLRCAPVVRSNQRTLHLLCARRPLAPLVAKVPPQSVPVSWVQSPPAPASAPALLPSVQSQTTRSLTKFSLKKGKRKSVKAVIKRFKRLDWGIWIRTYTGRHKKLFKKSAARRRRLRQHVFTNSTQSWLLDKMVTDFWRRPKHWVDDPYEPYHRRDEFFATKRKTFKV